MEFDRIADIKRVDFIVASLRNTVPPGGEIIDIGCGNGIISRAVGTHGYQVLGIDVSERTISQAIADNALPNVRFKVAGAEEFQDANHQYDAVICSEVLEHLQDPMKLLRSIHFSLKKEGVLIVTVPNGKGPRELLVTRPVQQLRRDNGLLWKMVNRLKRSMGYMGTTTQSSAEDLSHLQFFTRQALRKLAAAADFTIVRINATNFLEQVFPFSLFARRSKTLQRLDSHLADVLPLAFTSGFMSVWKKN